MGRRIGMRVGHARAAAAFDPAFAATLADLGLTCTGDLAPAAPRRSPPTCPSWTRVAEEIVARRGRSV